MTGADVRSPCGQFAKRQGIIHFVFAEPRILSYNLQLKALFARSSGCLTLFAETALELHPVPIRSLFPPTPHSFLDPLNMPPAQPFHLASKLKVLSNLVVIQ